MKTGQHLLSEKGQAMAEAMILSSVIFLGSFFLLAVFFNQIIAIVVDDSLEDYFFCQIQKKQSCKDHLQTQLKILRLQNIQLTELSLPPDFEITLTAQTSYNYEIHKQRKLHFNRDIDFF